MSAAAGRGRAAAAAAALDLDPVAMLTATVVVVPVAFRLWLKAVHQNQPLPTAVYQDPVANLRVVAPGW